MDKFNRKDELSGKMLSHEDIINCKTLEDVYEKIMNKEFKDLIDLDIEDLTKQLEEKFKLDLRQENDWYSFTERFYRRHVIIHNNSFPDEKYREKTRNSITERLVTDEKYLNDSLTIFKNIATKITDFLSQKYPSVTK